MCLLNIPNVMRRYGNIRNIWEGGLEGEGFLRKYKKEMKNGLMPKWQIWTVRNLLKRGVNKESIDLPKDWKEPLTDNCRIYKSFDALQAMIKSNKPISAIKIGINIKSELFILH